MLLEVEVYDCLATHRIVRNLVITGFFAIVIIIRIERVEILFWIELIFFFFRIRRIILFIIRIAKQFARTDVTGEFAGFTRFFFLTTAASCCLRVTSSLYFENRGNPINN